MDKELTGMDSERYYELRKYVNTFVMICIAVYLLDRVIGIGIYIFQGEDITEVMVSSIIGGAVQIGLLCMVGDGKKIGRTVLLALWGISMISTIVLIFGSFDSYLMMIEQGYLALFIISLLEAAYSVFVFFFLLLNAQIKEFISLNKAG